MQAIYSQRCQHLFLYFYSYGGICWSETRGERSVRNFVIVDAECGEVSNIAALTPALAARAVDLSFGDSDPWNYATLAPGTATTGPGFHVYELPAGYSGGEPGRAAPMAFVLKTLRRPVQDSVIVRLRARAVTSFSAAAAMTALAIIAEVVSSGSL